MVESQHIQLLAMAVTEPAMAELQNVRANNASVEAIRISGFPLNDF
jgi:hypothetical protein